MWPGNWCNTPTQEKSKHSGGREGTLKYLSIDTCTFFQCSDCFEVVKRLLLGRLTEEHLSCIGLLGCVNTFQFCHTFQSLYENVMERNSLVDMDVDWRIAFKLMRKSSTPGRSLNVTERR